MNEDTKKYYQELAQNFIELTLDLNTFEKVIKDITEIVNSRCKSDTKIKKIKAILGEINEDGKTE